MVLVFGRYKISTRVQGPHLGLLEIFKIYNWQKPIFSLSGNWSHNILIFSVLHWGNTFPSSSLYLHHYIQIHKLLIFISYLFYQLLSFQPICNIIIKRHFEDYKEECMPLWKNWLIPKRFWMDIYSEYLGIEFLHSNITFS